MDMEKRIMREKIESLERALVEMTQEKADRDIEIAKMQGEINSLKAHLQLIMRDREVAFTPRIFN